jgi:hypothetical protein
VVAVADLLGQVLGQVPDAAPGVLGSGEYTLGVEPFSEPGHVVGFGVGGEGVEGLVRGGQDFPVAGSR